MKSKLYSILKMSPQPLSAAEMWESAEVRAHSQTLTQLACWILGITNGVLIPLSPRTASSRCPTEACSI